MRIVTSSALVGAVIVPAHVHAADWRQVAARPNAFVGQRIELSPAFCGSGGAEATDPKLFQCSIGDGGLLVQSRQVSFTPEARAKAESCGGLDVLEQSSFCRFVVTFTPGHVGASSPDPGGKRRTPLLEGEKLEVR